jgi:Rps23 Pro-64 3,4-dihydroxylase Tpa1-like proline 4-hydroxylase
MKLDTLIARIPEYRDSFSKAWPFRHVVIDDFLNEDLAENVLADFPAPVAMDTHGSNSKRLVGLQISPRSRNYSFKPSLEAFFNHLKSKQLREAIQGITGIESTLVSDPDYYGSGLLLASNGGLHKIHADRTYNPNPNFFPRYVLLMYFNKEWRNDYGGGLQLWDRNIRKCVTIQPIFNRCVIFEITSQSYHSIEDVNCPSDVYRKALNYYYLSEAPPPNSFMHDTIFFPRPGERISYWKDQLVTNFPVNFLSAVSSRSSLTRDIYSSLRALFKGSPTGTKPQAASAESLTRWSKFNEDPN